MWEVFCHFNLDHGLHIQLVPRFRAAHIAATPSWASILAIRGFEHDHTVEMSSIYSVVSTYHVRFAFFSELPSSFQEMQQEPPTGYTLDLHGYAELAGPQRLRH